MSGTPARGSRRDASIGVIAAVCAVIPILVVTIQLAIGQPSAAINLAFAPVTSIFAAVGWLLAVRRPDNVIGPLCLLFAAVFALYFPIDLLIRAGAATGLVALLATVSSASDAPGFIIVALILVLFPTGRVPARRWRWATWLAVAGSLASLVGFGFQEGPLAAYPMVDNPLGIPGYPGELIGELGYLALLVLLITAVVALIVRWRGGSTVERTQVKWVAAAAAVLAIGESINLATFDPTNPLGSPVTLLASSVATGLVPIAIAVAILRYRLYEIDRLISRTLSWGLVTGILVVVFGGLVIGLQAALTDVTQGSTLAVAASTLAAFALFAPVRRRVQHVVDRRFDRARYDGERTAAAFAERLRDEVDLDALGVELRHTVEAAMRPSASSLWLADRGPG